jgi:hypothetical protein
VQKDRTELSVRTDSVGQHKFVYVGRCLCCGGKTDLAAGYTRLQVFVVGKVAAVMCEDANVGECY